MPDRDPWPTTQRRHVASTGRRPGSWRRRSCVTAAVVLLPVAQTVWLSLQDYLLYDPDAATLRRASATSPRSSRDEVFWISLGHSAVWIVGVVGLQFLLGLGAALLLNQSFWWRGARARARRRALGAAERHHRPDVDLDVRLQRRRHQRHPDPHRPDRRARRLAGAARHRALPRSCWRWSGRASRSSP